MDTWNRCIWLTVGIAISSNGCIATHPGVDNDGASVEAAHSLTDIEKIVGIVSNLPDWAKTESGYPSYYTPFNQADYDSYLLAAIKLQEYSPSVIRVALGQAVADAVQIGTIEVQLLYANLAVLMRVLFNVPATVPPSQRQVMGSYLYWHLVRLGHRQTSPLSYYPVRWPVSLNTHNQVTEIDEFMPPHGSNHNFLGEYDWFSSTWGYRTLPSCVGRCGNYNSAKICQCDTACASYNDCCVDLDHTCN